jgi:hypothetical protein
MRFAMSEDRLFPILRPRGASIPWEFIAPHETQALRNHSQSLETLASRGGLSWVETFSVLRGLYPYWEGTERQAELRVKILLERWEDVRVQP